MAIEHTRLSLQPVKGEDFEALLALRIAAMRPSLERLGRYDPERARARLQAGFEPRHMEHIVLDGRERIGFVTMHAEGDAWRLEHLYLAPGHQGQGIGAWVMQAVLRAAHGRDVLVSALRDSEANRFYRQHRFVLTHEEPLDLHYRRAGTGVARAA